MARAVVASTMTPVTIATDIHFAHDIIPAHFVVKILARYRIAKTRNRRSKRCFQSSRNVISLA